MDKAYKIRKRKHFDTVYKTCMLFKNARSFEKGNRQRNLAAHAY